MEGEIARHKAPFPRSGSATARLAVMGSSPRSTHSDIHVYSIDEAFLDVTQYLSLYQLTARELAVKIMADIRETTGMPAAAGIGTNLYLAKTALDLTAKHTKDRIGVLDEELYRQTLWDHRPLTDFWRVGEGTANRLARAGILTMGDIARAEEQMLYGMFGIDAELRYWVTSRNASSME